MRDQGIDKGSVRTFDTMSSQFAGYFSFRKMFWNYLRKLHVAFKDDCCPAADRSDKEPVAYDESQGQLVRFDGTNWVPVTSFSTTTTTTVAPTTTTTTTV